MKQLLLAAASYLGPALSGWTTGATRIDFTYTGSLIEVTVPTTGLYQIITFGAGRQRRLPGLYFCSGGVGVGGRGAEIGGDFILTAGEILQIAVGGKGDGFSDGGGLGTGGGADTGSGGGGDYSGGGYSGGGGIGTDRFDLFGPGGGGGSFDAGIDQILVADLQTSNGEVVITKIVTPERAPLALLGSALGDRARRLIERLAPSKHQSPSQRPAKISNRVMQQTHGTTLAALNSN